MSSPLSPSATISPEIMKVLNPTGAPLLDDDVDMGPPPPMPGDVVGKQPDPIGVARERSRIARIRLLAPYLPQHPLTRVVSYLLNGDEESSSYATEDASGQILALTISYWMLRDHTTSHRTQILHSCRDHFEALRNNRVAACIDVAVDFGHVMASAKRDGLTTSLRSDLCRLMARTAAADASYIEAYIHTMGVLCLYLIEPEERAAITGAIGSRFDPTVQSASEMLIATGGTLYTEYANDWLAAMEVPPEIVEPNDLLDATTSHFTLKNDKHRMSILMELRRINDSEVREGYARRLIAAHGESVVEKTPEEHTLLDRPVIDPILDLRRVVTHQVYGQLMSMRYQTWNERPHTRATTAHIRVRAEANHAIMGVVRACHNAWAYARPVREETTIVAAIKLLERRMHFDTTTPTPLTNVKEGWRALRVALPAVRILNAHIVAFQELERDVVLAGDQDSKARLVKLCVDSRRYINGEFIMKFVHYAPPPPPPPSPPRVVWCSATLCGIIKTTTTTTHTS